jgi:hypothetical protein
MRVRVGIAAHFGEGVNGVFGLAVITESAITLVDLLELAEGVRFRAGVPPHFLTLHKEGVPVVDPRVDC